MFIYLSKKIAIPNNTRLNCISWNRSDGYIAVGGDDGLLKVLKLDAVTTTNVAGGPNPVGAPGGAAATEGGGASVGGINKQRGLAAVSNLSMNQTLEGHTDGIQVITWNETHRKLTTSDRNGVIIVWMLYKGAWYEEMLNNRKKSTVAGMSWSSNGQKICIIYEDGAIVVGSVDGNRIWGKELKGVHLSAVQWSPDNKLLLFSLLTGQVHLYDNQGNFVMVIDIKCLDKSGGLGMAGNLAVCGLQWYNGMGGYMYSKAPSLAICYVNGCMQLMRNESDADPVLLNTRMSAVSCSWNHNGSLIAIAGRQMDDAKTRESNVVQFYNPFGEHLRTLKVPGVSISSAVWEGGSLRVALAVDSFVYFANIRPDYKWCHFSRAIVYTSGKQQKNGVCVTFWDTVSDQCHMRYVSDLIAMASCGDYCVLVSPDEAVGVSGANTGTVNGIAWKNNDAPEAENSSFLLLCNTIGTPIDGKHADIDVQYVTMNHTHVVAASKENFLVWPYSTPRTGRTVGAHQPPSSDKFSPSSSKPQRGQQPQRNQGRIYHVDDNPSGAADVIHDLEQILDVIVSRKVSTDPICAVACSDRILVVGRESGVILQYTLPHVALCARYKASARIHKLAINCTSSRLSVIDITGIFTVLEVMGVSKTNRILSGGDAPTPGVVEASDVTPDFDATSDSYGKLERKDVWAMCWASDNPMLFAIMEKTRMYIFRGANPEEPISSSGYICNFEDLEIQTVLFDEIMEAPERPRKEHLIKQEVKSLRDTRMLLDKVGITEATQFIEDNPHPRLWLLLAEAALRQMQLNVAEAAFIRSQNYAGIIFVKKIRATAQEAIRKALVATYFKQFDEAERLYIDADRRDLALILRETLGDWFRVIQMMKNGVAAPDMVLEVAYNATAEYFAQYNNWTAALEYYTLAKNRAEMVECYGQLEDYASLLSLIESLSVGDPILVRIADIFAADAVYDVAVPAYTKAGNIQAAVDLCVMHNKWNQAVQLAQEYNLPEIASLFVKYTAHLVDRGLLSEAIEINVQAEQLHSASALVMRLANKEAKKTNNDLITIKKLYVYAARLTDDNLNWKHAEAYHYLILTQQHLYAEQFVLAMYTAYKLQTYADILDEPTVYALVILASVQAGCYEVCSSALMKVKSLPQLTSDNRRMYDKLSVDIFKAHKPDNTGASIGKRICTNCNESTDDWLLDCPACYMHYPTCVASGRPLDASTHTPWLCSTCHHMAEPTLMRFRKSCPLCHAATA